MGGFVINHLDGTGGREGLERGRDANSGVVIDAVEDTTSVDGRRGDAKAVGGSGDERVERALKVARKDRETDADKEEEDEEGDHLCALVGGTP